MAAVEAAKAVARQAALARRAVAYAQGGAQAEYLSEVLAGYRGVPLGGYLPMRTEIDPLRLSSARGKSAFAAYAAMGPAMGNWA